MPDLAAQNYEYSKNMKIRRKNNQSQLKKSRLTINHFLLIALALLAGTQVWLSNRVATSGRQLAELEVRSTLLEDENRKLISQNVDFLSLHELTQRAETLGYIEPENIINMSDGAQNLALK